MQVVKWRLAIECMRMWVIYQITVEMQGDDADEDIEILERASQGEEIEGDVLEKF